MSSEILINVAAGIGALLRSMGIPSKPNCMGEKNWPFSFLTLILRYLCHEKKLKFCFCNILPTIRKPDEIIPDVDQISLQSNHFCIFLVKQEYLHS